MTDSSNKDNCHSCGNQLQAGLVCYYEGKLYCTETCRDAFNATPAPKCGHCGKEITQDEVEKWKGRCNSSKGTNCYFYLKLEKDAKTRADTEKYLRSIRSRDPFSPGTGWVFPQWRVTF